jgi:thiol-disulfide isomerase/thioredoxin
VVLFWRNEWIYSLPTPVPANYKAVEPGTTIDVAPLLPFKTHRPVFLHFFNPDCPCSRFNIPHFKSLVKQYGDQVLFAIVPVTNKKFTTADIQHLFKMDIPVVFDSTLAATCGVYSTPQAAIIDTNQQLYYRGNYNKSRYCANPKTEYARQALDQLFHNNAAILFDQFALKAYGCQLPKCTRQ